MPACLQAQRAGHFVPLPTSQREVSKGRAGHPEEPGQPAHPCPCPLLSTCPRHAHLAPLQWVRVPLYPGEKAKFLAVTLAF